MTHEDTRWEHIDETAQIHLIWKQWGWNSKLAKIAWIILVAHRDVSSLHQDENDENLFSPLPNDIYPIFIVIEPPVRYNLLHKKHKIFLLNILLFFLAIHVLAYIQIRWLGTVFLFSSRFSISSIYFSLSPTFSWSQHATPRQPHTVLRS